MSQTKQLNIKKKELQKQNEILKVTNFFFQLKNTVLVKLNYPSIRIIMLHHIHRVRYT